MAKINYLSLTIDYHTRNKGAHEVWTRPDLLLFLLLLLCHSTCCLQGNIYFSNKIFHTLCYTFCELHGGEKYEEIQCKNNVSAHD